MKMAFFSSLLAACLLATGYQAKAAQIFSRDFLFAAPGTTTIYWAVVDTVIEEIVFEVDNPGTYFVSISDPSIAGFTAAVTDGVNNRIGAFIFAGGGSINSEDDEQNIFGISPDLMGVSIDYFRLDVGTTGGIIRFSGHTGEMPQGVPDGGATALLLGLAGAGLCAVRRHLT